MNFLEKAKLKLSGRQDKDSLKSSGPPATPIFDDGEDNGFYAWSAEALISTPQLKPLINDISIALGGRAENFTKYLRPSILQAALYMQQLPAAESVDGKPIRAFGHHVSAGGLLLHSLETMYFALNDSRLAFFNRGVNPASRDDNLNVSRIACALAGLLHDIGKLNDPIVVTYTQKGDKKQEHVWSLVESIPEFLARVHGFATVEDVFKSEEETGRKRPRYYIKGWRKGRSDRHEYIGPFLMRSFLSKATMRLLSGGNNDLLTDFMTAAEWRQLPSDYTGVRKNIIFDVWNSADTTSSAKDKKLSSLNALTPLTANLDVKRALTKALWQLELQGQAAIDKADLNCFIFTHAATCELKFFCLIRCDAPAEGFLLKWIRTASEIYGDDVLQEHAPTQENILQLMELCNMLLPSNRSDKLFIILPDTLKPIDGITPFPALCFRSWHDCIEPGGTIYSLNEDAYCSLKCAFTDCQLPETLLPDEVQTADSILGSVDQGAVIWENGIAHVVSSADKPADKPAAASAENYVEQKTDATQTSPDAAVNTGAAAASCTAAAEDAAAADEDNAGEDKAAAAAAAADAEPDIVPAASATESLAASSKESAAAVSLADFLPGAGAAVAVQPETAADDTADENAKLQNEKLLSDEVPQVFCGGKPVFFNAAEDDADKAGRHAEIRNLDTAAADFAERRSMVDDVLTINSPDLSLELPDEDEKPDAAKLRSMIDSLVNTLDDPKFARNLQIMIDARLKGKFSHIDYVTADGRHCYAAFLWNNQIKKNANAKQLLAALKQQDLLAGMAFGTEQVAKEIYYYGCAQLDRRITEIFVHSSLKPRKLVCREHPYARIEGRPPEARSVIEFLKYRILSLDADESLYGYKARGFAEDASGRHINAHVLLRCLEDVGAQGGASRVHQLLAYSNQTTPPYLLRQGEELVLYFALPESAVGGNNK